MINKIFDWCVELLLKIVKKFGTTYKAINVWIFVVIRPIITIILLVYSINCLLNH